MPRLLPVALLALLVVLAIGVTVMPDERITYPISGSVGLSVPAKLSNDTPKPVYGPEGTLLYNIGIENLRRDDTGNPVLVWATLCLPFGATESDASTAADHYLGRYSSLLHAIVHVHATSGDLNSSGPCGDNPSLLFTKRVDNGRS